MQLSASLPLLSYTAPLPTGHGHWYEIAVRGTGTAVDWPRLTPGANYWVVLAPATMLPISSATPVNGLLWGGLDISVSAVPDDVANDDAGGNLFTARELNSERVAYDGVCSTLSPQSVEFLAGAANWSAAKYSGEGQYRDFAAAGSTIRYGLQIMGAQEDLDSSATIPCECGMLDGCLTFRVSGQASENASVCGCQ